MKNHFRALLLIICCALNLLCSANGGVLNASDFIHSTDKDCALGLLRLFQKAKKEKYKKIVFQKGTYQVFANCAFEKFLFISNHDPGQRRIAFPIIGFENFELEGNGAEFIMHGLVVPIVLEDCKNVIIKNLFFDHYRPSHSELEVVAVDSVARTVDFKIADTYPYQIRNDELFFLKEGFEHNLDNGIFWDPATRAVAYQSRQVSVPAYRPSPSVITTDSDRNAEVYPVDPVAPAYRYRGTANMLVAHQLKPGLVRVKGYNQLPKKGWVLTAKGLNGYNRLAPGLRLMDCLNIRVQNVTVYHAAGMGLIAEGCRDVVLDGFNVFPRPEGGRMLSTSADATHFVGCRGKISILNCRFEQQLDDATNIHGTYMRVEDFASTRVGASIGHFQQTGFRFAVPGDSIALVNPAESATPLAFLTIKEVEVVNPRFYTISFNERLPRDIKKGFYLENITAYPEVEISNCKIINNRARGILLSSPKKTVIENNVFSSMMAAIQCPNEFTFWYESGYAGDLVISKNTFLDNTYGNPNPSPVINIVAVSKNGKPIHGKVTIENNRFTNYSSNILLAAFAREVVFQNNTIMYSGNYPLDAASPVIHLESVQKAVLRNNRYDSRFTQFLESGSTVKDLTNQENNRLNAIK